MTRLTMTRNQERFASWTTDVLVYIVVLNLFVEFNDAITIESFWISILTALLLKGLLDIVAVFEHGVGAFFEEKGTTAFRLMGLTAKFVIMFTSKLIILEIIDLVFGDEVKLGHILDVLPLIITMMLARAILGKLYQSLGDK